MHAKGDIDLSIYACMTWHRVKLRKRTAESTEMYCSEIENRKKGFEGRTL